MASSQSSSSKTERKIIEKNRRNQMKSLYSKLNSLLPKPTSNKEALSLPDQVDAAIDYIKSLQTQLEKSKEKKESLIMGRKRLHSAGSSNQVPGTLKSPKIAIQEVGSALEITLISGQENQFMFYQIIQLIHEEGAVVVNASFSTVGDSIFHVIHAEVGASTSGIGAAIISERLNKLVHGSPSEVTSQLELWDYEICPETWEF
nr:basic helix-loop-helix transcription factor [Loropetalum chinense var. rubrum]